MGQALSPEQLQARDYLELLLDNDPEGSEIAWILDLINRRVFDGTSFPQHEIARRKS